MAVEGGGVGVGVVVIMAGRTILEVGGAIRDLVGMEVDRLTLFRVQGHHAAIKEVGDAKAMTQSRTIDSRKKIYGFPGGKTRVRKNTIS